MTRVTLCTASTPGAVAILQLHGEGVIDALQQLTGRTDWPERRALLCNFAGIDEGLAILINPGVAQLMPHGGPRVVQKLIEHLTAEIGCAYDPEPDTRAMYPEASSPIEADMLDAIARAASPAAIDLLAAQPELWRAFAQNMLLRSDQPTMNLDSGHLDRLLIPPTVVVAGPPNCGKSTLTNALMGRAVSIVADLPGTTRDWVGGLVELGPTDQAVAVQWLDTPGLHASDDTIEQRAIALARHQIEHADLLISMRGIDQNWLSASDLPREPDIWVVNKYDEPDPDYPKYRGDGPDTPQRISASFGHGLDHLQRVVIDEFGLSYLSSTMRWAFNPTLRAISASGDIDQLRVYVGL